MHKDLQRTCTAFVFVLNLLFGDVLVAVVVAVFFSSLFLDIVPSSSADITRVLRGLFSWTIDLLMSFRLVSKQRKTYNTVGMSSLTI